MIASMALPLNDPILIFTVIISIVLLAPIILRRVNMPDIIGLVVAGVIIGPHGFNVLSREIGLSIFGSIGLLYLMFLAGLEIDLNDFFRRRREGTMFGVLTFLLPFVPGFIVFHFVLDYRIESALLVATMLASHTLVSYPILGRFGIINHRIVTITIAGTIIADTTVLIILGVISDSVQGDLSVVFWMRTLLYFILFFVFVLKILPSIAQWFFRTQTEASGLHFVFVLTAIFISATVAELLKIEPLIGAFFCGLSLNRYIPRETILLERILFVGNTLFIPFFLISIGMLVDTEVLINDPQSWLIIGVLGILAIGGKFLASWIMQLFYKFNASSRNLIFGLSTARAASAIAIMIVGAEFGLVDDQLLNSTIFIILLTSIVSSMVTQKAGQQISSIYTDENQGGKEEGDKVMVALGNPENMKHLINFGLMLKANDSKSPLYPLTVFPKGKNSYQKYQESRKKLVSVIDEIDAPISNADLITRMDINVVEGISKAIKEFGINRVVIGWNSQTTSIDRLFGTMLDKLIRKTNRMILVSKLENDVSKVGNIQTFLPENVQGEKGFHDLLNVLVNLSENMKRRMLIYSTRKTLDAIKNMNLKGNGARELIMVETQLDEDFFEKLSSGPLGQNDLLFFVKARRKTVAYSKIIDSYPAIIEKYFSYHNLILIYPEQIIIPKGIFQLYNLNN
jgi:Kef-type K+ transport system membrane component KefB